jgi:hypothetical protein
MSFEYRKKGKKNTAISAWFRAARISKYQSWNRGVATEFVVTEDGRLYAAPCETHDPFYS